jgi:Zn-dependent peptidase ImmA (M78 family)
VPPAKLERIDIDDVATSVERVVGEIHRQLGSIDPPVPVHEIARALDIDEIRAIDSTNFEAMLITGRTRNTGSICVNKASGRQRQRYSIAHELGHFLCGWHRLNSDQGFRCSKQDMAVPLGDQEHVVQEKEANQFAIELLAPERLVAGYLRGLPEFEQVLAMHTRLDISKTAAARRYVKLHREPLAVIFASNGIFQYADRGPSFPFISMTKGQQLPETSWAKDEMLSEMVEADPLDWGLGAHTGLATQSLNQQDGHQIVLLLLDTESPEDR